MDTCGATGGALWHLVWLPPHFGAGFTGFTASSSLHGFHDMRGHLQQHL